jgi:hypothetical protein
LVEPIALNVMSPYKCILSLLVMLLVSCGDSTLDPLRSAQSVTIYSVFPYGDDFFDIPPGSPVERVGEYNHIVLGKSTISDPAVINEIADAIQDSIDAGRDKRGMACFMPRHAVVVQGAIELVICFECNSLGVSNGPMLRIGRAGEDRLDQIWSDHGLRVHRKPLLEIQEEMRGKGGNITNGGS